MHTFAVTFDDTSSAWSDQSDYNELFLRGTQNYFCDVLDAKGVVLLNDIYDHLGLPRTVAGATHGWSLTSHDPEGRYIVLKVYSESDKSFTITFNTVRGVHFDYA